MFTELEKSLFEISGLQRGVKVAHMSNVFPDIPMAILTGWGIRPAGYYVPAQQNVVFCLHYSGGRITLSENWLRERIASVVSGMTASILKKSNKSNNTVKAPKKLPLLRM